MLLQKPENIFNDYHSSPMDKHVTKKQRLYLKHLQQPSADDFPSSPEKILDKEPNCYLNGKANKPKKKARTFNSVPPLLKRRLQRECLIRRAKVMLNKIEDCPDVNAVWTYDHRLGKYKWDSRKKVVSSDSEDTEVETEGLLEEPYEEMRFVITEVRGNASDVFENVVTSGDAETLVKEEYDEGNTETDGGGIVEILEGYNPAFQEQHITVQVDEEETVERPLNYEIKPKEKVKTDSEVDDGISDNENAFDDSLANISSRFDRRCENNGENLSSKRSVTGKGKNRKSKKCIKKAISVNKKTSPPSLKKADGKQTKEKMISRVGKHSKRLRNILKSVPPYWRSRNNFSSKKVLSKASTDEERKPTVSWKVRLLEAYHRKFSETTKEDDFQIVERCSKSEFSPSNGSENSEESIKLCLRRKKSKSAKGCKADSASSQVNLTDSPPAKKKSDKQGQASEKTSDDGYSLLDRELPGYNWLEKKIKSGEINASRRASTGSQENLTIQENMEQPNEQDDCNTYSRSQELTTAQPEDTVNDKTAPEEAAKPATNEVPQREVATNASPLDTELLPSEAREQLEVTSPESGVEIDVAPLSADDSEGDFLAQGVYLVIDESQINSENDANNTTSDLTKKRESTMEACSKKIHTTSLEDVSNESETRVEHEHICNNEECLLSAPERIRITNKKNVPSSLDLTSTASWEGNPTVDEIKSTEKETMTTTRSPISSVAVDLPLNISTEEAGTSSKTARREEDDKGKMNCMPSKPDCIVQSSDSSYNQHQTTAFAINKEIEVNKKEVDHITPVSCSKEFFNNDKRATRPSHIPVQQICKTSVTAVARKNDACTPNSVSSRGKFENVPTSFSESMPLVRPPMCTIAPNLTGLPVNVSNSGYTQAASQDVRASCMRRPEQYIPPTSLPASIPPQVMYQPNFKAGMESQCQSSEHHTPNSSAQNEKNFSISSLLELQSVASQPLLAPQANTRTETGTSAEVRPTTVIHKTQPSVTSISANNVFELSALRSRLEGKIQRPILPEPPKPHDDDSTDDIKIIYNKVASYKSQPITPPSHSQPPATNKDRGNYVPLASQTKSPCLIYQEPAPTTISERAEQQVNQTSTIHPLPAMPKPIPVQGPLHPSSVLMSPVMENIEQQRIYPAPPAETLQQIKDTQPLQTENISPGYQNISSYHAPPKSLREEVEYRKRELMYLDQLARKREKEFERLQNIRKSKIRLLKILENHMPTSLNKESTTQKTIPCYHCSQPEKPLTSESWGCQVMPAEMPSSSMVQPPTRTSPHVSNMCNTYHHYPLPNDRIKYELNNFIASFNPQMQEARKDMGGTATNSRKEHDVSLNREQPSQNNSTIPPSSVSRYGIPQSASVPTSNASRVLSVTQTTNRTLEINPITTMPSTRLEKGATCQQQHPVRSIPPPHPPPPYAAMTEPNPRQTVPMPQNYPNCQYQNSSNYDPLYPGPRQNAVAPPARAYEQQKDSPQPPAPNTHMEPRYKDGVMTENAQQQYYGNKIWTNQWPPRHNIQRMPINYPPRYQQEPRMPNAFWPVTNHPPVDMFSSPQRMRFQPDVAQQRVEDSSVGLVFVDASKTAHQCNYCNRNAIFLCSSCKKAWYCGRECQRRSWAQHSTVCVAAD